MQDAECRGSIIPVEVANAQQLVERLHHVFASDKRGCWRGFSLIDLNSE